MTASKEQVVEGITDLIEEYDKGERPREKTGKAIFEYRIDVERTEGIEVNK